MERIYCTLDELVEALGLLGVKAWRENLAMDMIRAASEWIDGNLGRFIPTTEARRFDGEGGIDLWISDLLAATSVVDGTDTLLTTDYLLYPRQRLWQYGPYCRITVDPDATTISVWSNEEDEIVITGRWGLYELTKATGAIVASQTDSSTSLVVDNAGGISPGAVLLIGSEQETVEATGAATDSTANLAEALDASEEEVDVDNAALVFNGEIIKIEFEQMKVRDKSGNTLLVERGWNGTKRTTHTTGLDVYVQRTFTVKRGANGTTAASHTTAAVSRYLAPYDVNYLCRQMAGLMLKKAEGGFAGKVGNVELGEVFYLQEFPKEAIEKIRGRYFVPVL